MLSDFVFKQNRFSLSPGCFSLSWEASSWMRVVTWWCRGVSWTGCWLALSQLTDGHKGLDHGVWGVFQWPPVCSHLSPSCVGHTGPGVLRIASRSWQNGWAEGRKIVIAIIHSKRTELFLWNMSQVDTHSIYHFNTGGFSIPRHYVSCLGNAVSPRKTNHVVRILAF